ncbi:flavin reductase family protein [Mesorhizobium sp. M0700]
MNVLREADQELAQIFADMEARYAAGEWQELSTGAPMLKRAIAACDCEIVDRYEIGTHHILIGRIIDQMVQEGMRSLLSFDRRFGSFTALDG